MNRRPLGHAYPVSAGRQLPDWTVHAAQSGGLSRPCRRAVVAILPPGSDRKTRTSTRRLDPLRGAGVALRPADLSASVPLDASDERTRQLTQQVPGAIGQLLVQQPGWPLGWSRALGVLAPTGAQRSTSRRERSTSRTVISRMQTPRGVTPQR